MADKIHQREEAIRLKTLAESKYTSSSLKSALNYATRAHTLFPSLTGLPEMLAAFRILHSSSTSTSPELYNILGVEPFSPLSSIKAQYKKLALLLHPDKNTLKEASDDAFKIVNDAFSVLSDRVRGKEYDSNLRLALLSRLTTCSNNESQAATTEGVMERGDVLAGETFWTACSNCRLFHKCNRKYVGCSLVCPNCDLSFEGVEVVNDDGDCDENEEILGDGVRKSARVRARKGGFVEELGDLGKNGVSEKLQRGRSKNENKKKRVSWGEEKTKSASTKMAIVDEKELTLAEIRMEALKKKKGAKKGEMNAKITENRGRRRLEENGNMEVMTVEDSDFYDFDKDRVEKSFKKGQVWAIYDDDDGMPRHYGLIDDVVSVNPFEVKMSWLDLQSSTDERLICLEKMGFHISCGTFKVGRKDTINLLNIFSHMVDCERVARELYRIYPRKGSIWGLYNESELDNSKSTNGRSYDIVVFLTSYSEMHGLSMAYLEKVEGYRAVFKRKEIGYHAIRWLEKDDVRVVSHQIPARKLSSNDAPDLSCDCWELDPASLSPDLLSKSALSLVASEVSSDFISLGSVADLSEHLQEKREIHQQALITDTVVKSS